MTHGAWLRLEVKDILLDQEGNLAQVVETKVGYAPEKYEFTLTHKIKGLTKAKDHIFDFHRYDMVSHDKILNYLYG